MLSGSIDDYGRALIPLVVTHPESGTAITIHAWIDTAFTGWLSLTPEQVARLGLTASNRVPGRVADGSEVTFQTAECLVNWFGSPQAVQAIVSPGAFALVGIHLMEACTLLIDYPSRQVALTLTASL